MHRFGFVIFAALVAAAFFAVAATAAPSPLLPYNASGLGETVLRGYYNNAWLPRMRIQGVTCNALRVYGNGSMWMAHVNSDAWQNWKQIDVFNVWGPDAPAAANTTLF